MPILMFVGLITSIHEYEVNADFFTESMIWLKRLYK